MKEAPITTIEILSPKQALQDLTDKIYDQYFPAGVQSAWIVSPAIRTVSIYYPDESFVSFASGKISDKATNITLDIDEVFEDLE